MAYMKASFFEPEMKIQGQDKIGWGYLGQLPGQGAPLAGDFVIPKPCER